MNHTGFIFAIVGTLLFSLKSIFIKLLYQQGLDANSVLVLRMMISLPFFIGILWWQLKKKPHVLSLALTIKIIVLGFFGYYLASLLDLKSLEYISAQLERLGLFTYPLMVAVLGFTFFKTPITRTIIISLALTYLGLCIVVLQEFSLSGNNILKGTALVLASAFSFALYVLLSKPIIEKVGSILFTSIAMISSSIFGFIHGTIFVDTSTLTVSKTAWGLLLLLAIFSTVIPSFLMSESIKRIGPTQTGIVGVLGPVFTIGLAILILNETLSPTAMIGIVLILTGVINLILSKKHA